MEKTSWPSKLTVPEMSAAAGRQPFDEAEDGARPDGGFAAAGFADEAEGFAVADGEGDIIDGARTWSPTTLRRKPLRMGK